MKNLMELYRYEVKKIIKRKLVWISLFICTMLIVVTILASLTGTYYVDGEVADTHYHMFQVDREYRKALSGRVINQELLEETIEAYRKIPSTAERYTLTKEYQTYARPYSDIFNLIRSWMKMDAFSVINWEPDETTLYATRNDLLEASWKELMLSSIEREYWREKETQINKPITYFYHEGYIMIMNAFSTVGVLMLLFVAISLSSVFTEEHTRRTDQLMLSSAKGKSIVYWAKIFAGISVATISSIWMAVFTVVLALGVYGAEGFQTALQIFFSSYLYSYPLTIGQACFISYGILIITSMLVSVFVMVLSEVLHNNIATLAISTGFIIAGMILNIPEQYRVLAQLWNYLPTTFLALWNVFDIWLITIGGHCFPSWQIVPIIYIFCGIVIAVAGIHVYQRYQVSGR